MRPQNDERVIRARKYFKEALLSILSEKSFDSITTIEISNRAGYSRVTFYSHFLDKYDLIEQLITEKLNGLKKKIAETNLTGISKDNDYTHPSTIAMFYYIFTHSNFFQLMLSEKRVPGFIPHFIQTLYEMYKDVYKIMPEDENIDRNIYLMYVTAATFGVISYWVTTKMKYSPSYMADQLTQIVNERPQKILFKSKIKIQDIMQGKEIDKRVIRTKNNLKHAFLNLVSIKEFDNISITDICEEATYNRATFYSHFESKIDLATELIDEVMVNLINEMNTVGEKSDDINTPFESIIHLFKYVSKHERFFKIMLSGKKVPGSFSIIREHFRKFFRKKIDIIKDYSYSVEWEIYISYITSATIGVLAYWIESGLKHKPIYLAEQFTLILHNKPKPI